MSQRGLLKFAVGVAIVTALAIMGAKAVAQGTAQPTNDPPNQYIDGERTPDLGLHGVLTRAIGSA